MTDESIRDTLSPTHHALLFAWMSREVIQRIGREEGERIIRGAARRYGEQRGNRMALRAQANGHALSMTNYMAYGEWEPGPDAGKGKQEIVERAPHTKVRVLRCPWHTAWESNDLIPYGRLYCQVIDGALVHGFKPELTLEVTSTLSNDAPYCEFVFHDANLTLIKTLVLAYRQAVRPGKMAVMPWDYHLGHLYKTMGEVVIEELGSLGREAIETAMLTFANHYGEEAEAIVRGYQDTNFDCLS